MKPLIQENGATTKSTGKRLSSKGISVVDDPELEQAKTSDNSEALLSLSINDHSEKYAVLYYTIPICLLSAMMDNNQIDIVTRNAKQYGGGYFVLIYFVFNLLVGFAPIELFVAMSQYTRAGMTKIFGIYAKLFKCIGIGMLATVFCFQSAAIHRTADKLAFITRYGSHPEQLITCHFPEFDCSHVILSNMSSRICCPDVSKNKSVNCFP